MPEAYRFLEAITALETIWADYETTNADIIDGILKNLGLEDVQAFMMYDHILSYRKKYNDYLIAWHTNKINPCKTIDSLKRGLEKDDTDKRQENITENISWAIDKYFKEHLDAAGFYAMRDKIFTGHDYEPEDWRKWISYIKGQGGTYFSSIFD